MLIRKNNLTTTQLVFAKQTSSHNYFRVLISGKHSVDENANVVENEISIRDDKQQYTNEFIELLKDYYLYL